MPTNVPSSEGGREMSGGIGAVSAGLSEPVLEAVIILLVLVIAFVGWKLLKVALTMLKG